MEKAIATKIARRNLCKAHAGDIMMPKIVKMAFGDGGVDESGVELKPTGEETSLYRELMQKNIERHDYIGEDETTCRYYATLGVGECTGKYISEIGLIDEEGDLVSIRTFLPMGKTEDIPFEFYMEEMF